MGHLKLDEPTGSLLCWVSRRRGAAEIRNYRPGVPLDRNDLPTADSIIAARRILDGTFFDDADTALEDQGRLPRMLSELRFVMASDGTVVDMGSALVMAEVVLRCPTRPGSHKVRVNLRRVWRAVDDRGAVVLQQGQPARPTERQGVWRDHRRSS